MFNGAIAIARIDGQIVLVQIVQSSRTSSHIEVLKYAYFGDRSFLANITSTPPIRIPAADIIQFLPSSVQPTGASRDLLTLSDEHFNEFIERSTANQSELEAKWAQALALGQGFSAAAVGRR